jgi:hypothetical protein
MSIDLGSVPFSYLVLDRRPAPPPAPEAVRFLGRPRVGKAFARVLGCSANGIQERRIEKRRLPEAYRLARKGSLPPLGCWRCDKELVVELGCDRQP